MVRKITARDMLQKLLTDGYKNECENNTSGIGSCYDGEHTPFARYADDACCHACIIDRFLKKGNWE